MIFVATKLCRDKHVFGERERELEFELELENFIFQGL